MQIRVGFEMEYQCPGPTPMILALSIHYSRASDLVRPDHLVTYPPVPVTAMPSSYSWQGTPHAPSASAMAVMRSDSLTRSSSAPRAMVVPLA